MQLDDLVDVLRFVETSIVSKNLIQQYTQLSGFFQQAAAPNVGANKAQLQNLNAQIAAVRDSLAKSQGELEQPAHWGPTRRSVFETLGAPSVIGRAAIQNVNQIIVQNALDYANAAQQIARIVQQLQQLQSRCSQLIAGLGALAPTSKVLPIEPESASMILTFRGDESARTLAELKDKAGTWDRMVHGFSRLVRAPLVSPKLLDVRRGSVVMELAAGISVVMALATAFNSMLAAREKALTARKLALEIKQLEMVDEQTPLTLEVAADAQIDKAIAETQKRLMDENEWGERDEANEVGNVLRLCLKDLANFYAGGGKLEFKFSHVRPADDAHRQVLEQTKQIQKEMAETIARVEELAERLDSMKQLPPSTTAQTS